MTVDTALLEPLVSRLINLFSEEETEAIARSSKFIERITSRLSGRIFLMLNVLRADGHLYQSLQDQCCYLQEAFGICIEHIRVFYMLRWQIELTFKAWESV